MKRTLLSLMLALALSACVGNVLSGQAKCNSDVGGILSITGDCTATIEKLEKSATQHIAVQTSDVMPFASVDYTVTVENGTVAITFVDFQGNIVKAQATPGSPATGNVHVQLDPLNQINFDLAPVDGTAENVDYKLHFNCDCMP